MTSDSPTDDAAPRPIRHAVVYANPSSASFDHAILDAYASEVDRHGQEAVIRDLYAMGFDPVLKLEERPALTRWAPAPDVAAELDVLHHSEALVLIYPIWFGTPPAILKGYVERVMGAGYDFRDLQEQAGQPALRGKHLLSFSTSGTSLAWLDEQEQVLSLRKAFDVYLWRGFAMGQCEHVMIDNVVPRLEPNYARQQLDRVRSTAARLCAALEDERRFGTPQGSSAERRRA
ncbi:MAG: NAD(P)H-dependent oxidoreductase [Chloroflexi bacterium]|nr:NAD(P)H-dependent oxidoreductase [Chloroflexota bacterium]